MPELPFDIIHAVLEQLEPGKDSSTLSACSRVCRHWLLVARKYLFACVTIEAVYHGRAYELPGGREVFHEHFTKPIRANPSHITHLYVLGALIERLNVHQLAPLIKSFPLLKHLYISFWNIAAVEKPQQAVQHSPSLEMLEIGNLVNHMASTGLRHAFIPPQRFINLLHHCSHAKLVVFYSLPIYFYTEFVEEPNPSSLAVPADFAPSSVRLLADPNDNHFLLHLLQYAPSTAGTLRTLHIVFRKLVYVASTFGHLLQVARNLEVLKLDFSNVGAEEELGGGQDFMRPLRALDSIRNHISPALRSHASLRTVILIAPRAPSDYWPLCIGIISSLPTSLRSVELRMDLDGKMELPLAQLGDRLSGVEVAKMVLWGSAEAEDERRAAWSKYLHDGLPDLDSRGILQIWFSTSPE